MSRIYAAGPLWGEIFETTLFPGDKHTFQRVATSPSISKMREKNKDKKPIFYATVVGCIDYQFMFEDGHHQTGFIFDLGKQFQLKQTVLASGKISGLTWMMHRSSLLISILFPI